MPMWHTYTFWVCFSLFLYCLYQSFTSLSHYHWWAMYMLSTLLKLDLLTTVNCGQLWFFLYYFPAPPEIWVMRCYLLTELCLWRPAPCLMCLLWMADTQCIMQVFQRHLSLAFKNLRLFLHPYQKADICNFWEKSVKRFRENLVM